MNKVITFFIVAISCLFPYPEKSCIDNILFSNKDIIDNNIFLITAEIYSVDKEQIKIYVEKNKKFRIEYNQSIIISDQNKIINYNKKSNQLFVEKKDSLLNEIFFSIDNDELFYNNLKRYISLDNLKIYVDTFCTSIDSVKYHNFETVFKLNSFKFIDSDLKSLDLNIDEEKTFIYDFR